jgi:MFS family permease
LSQSLIVTIIVFLLATLFVKQYMDLSDNIWRLFLAQPLAMSATPAVVIAANFLAVEIAPTPELATLPLTMVIIGTAMAVLPATWTLKTMGRRSGTMLGLFLGFLGAIAAGISAQQTSFYLLLAGCLLIGVSAAFVAQLRFAALESIDSPGQAPKALSVLMSSGLVSAMLGPEIAVIGNDLVASPHGFAGSFYVLAGCYLCAILIIRSLAPIHYNDNSIQGEARPLWKIMASPVFIIAISSGVVAYSVMSYLMTASPLSMHADHAYAMDSIKWVVQSHVIAMYLPSLFAAFLVDKLGLRRLMLIGTGLYVLVVAVSLIGSSVMHYWWSMVLLGIGWNFLYLCGTLLLPNVYRSHERFKVQAVNDFSIFGIQAIASLSAGMILFSRGWANLVMVTIPVIIVMLMVTIWYISLFHKNKLQLVEETNG